MSEIDYENYNKLLTNNRVVLLYCTLSSFVQYYCKNMLHYFSGINQDNAGLMHLLDFGWNVVGYSTLCSV